LKNKKNIYILLPIVLVIWGVIISKIISYKSETVVNTNSTIFTPSSSSYEGKDTFSLIYNYPDPFISMKLMKNVEQNRFTPKNPSKISFNENKNSSFPQNISNLIFKGVIKNQSDGKSIAIVATKEGKSYYLQLEDTLNNMRLKKISNDSLIFFESKNKRIIYKVKDL
jgi:hypothetical protein